MVEGQQKFQEPAKIFEELDQLPISDASRVCTDKVCIIFGLAFILVLFIITFSLYDEETYLKSSFPTDSDGRLCGNELINFPYVYFVSLPDISKRVCVSSCPSSEDTKLNCFMTKSIGCRFSQTPGFEVRYYNNEPFQNRLGKFCLPKDAKVKDQLLVNTQLKTKFVFLNSLDTTIQCIMLTLVVSAFYCALVQCFPQTFNIYAIGLGILSNIGLIITIILYPIQNLIAKIIIGVILVLILSILISNVCKNKNMFKIHGIFLESASLMFNTDYYVNFFFIIIFLALQLVFLLLLIIQFMVFWSAGSLYFKPQQSLFWQFQGYGSTILSVFLIVQAIWGFSFLKQSFNFLISGSAVSWYYENKWSCLDPIRFFFTKHIGSVIGGSLITGTLTFWDYFFDFLKPQQQQNVSAQSFYDKCCLNYCKSCFQIFDLVRSDTMTYICLTGNPYCNSARFCEYISNQSILIKESKSPSRTYRICSHFFISSIVGLYAFKQESLQISLYVLFAIMGMALFISTFFISVHADAAEAIQILFLLNEELEKRKNQFTVEGFDRDEEGVFDNLVFKNERIYNAIGIILENQS